MYFLISMDIVGCEHFNVFLSMKLIVPSLIINNNNNNNNNLNNIIKLFLVIYSKKQ